MKGKLFHKPELVQHGQEMRTGALKKNAMEDDVSHILTSRATRRMAYISLCRRTTPSKLRRRILEIARRMQVPTRRFKQLPPHPQARRRQSVRLKVRTTRMSSTSGEGEQRHWRL